MGWRRRQRRNRSKGPGNPEQLGEKLKCRGSRPIPWLAVPASRERIVKHSIIVWTANAAVATAAYFWLHAVFLR